MERWAASTNEEYFSGTEDYSSKEDALKSAPLDLALDEGQSFYIGVKEPFVLSAMDSDSFLETLFGQHEDGLGEWADDWQAEVMDDEEIKKFIEQKTQEIADFVMSKNKPEFFLVKDIERVTVG
jgi:hypothetical protein